MNGIHDMGGMHGFGRVQREDNEPVFHEEWEKSVVAMSRVAGALGITNIDESRYGIEQMDPAKYLTSQLLRALAGSVHPQLHREGHHRSG